MHDDRTALLERITHSERLTENALKAQDEKIKYMGDSTARAIENVGRQLDGITLILGNLVRVEERQVHERERITGLIKSHEKQEIKLESLDLRLQGTEQKIPGLMEVRGWVLRGIFAGIGMIFTGCLMIFVPIILERVK